MLGGLEDLIGTRWSEVVGLEADSTADWVGDLEEDLQANLQKDLKAGFEAVCEVFLQDLEVLK